MAIPPIQPKTDTAQGNPSAITIKERTKPKVVKEPADKKTKKTKTTTTPIPQRLKWPDDWKDVYPGGFYLGGEGSAVIVSPRPRCYAFVDCIAFTVDGETIITLSVGGMVASGPLFLGGEGQPMGMVIPFPGEGFPLRGGAFQITSTGEDVSVGGICSFHYKELKSE